MVRRLIIRPLREDEYENYFKMRYEKATIHNPLLIKKVKGNIEMDVFDEFSLHVGAFLGEMLIGCARLVVPVNSQIKIKNYQNLKFIGSLSQARLREQEEISNYSLPTSTFLNENSLKTLEDYFIKIQQKGKGISEIGRLINFSDDSRIYRHIPALIRYIWALNMYFDIDFCFLNASQKHARFYERSFACQILFPSILINTGGPDLKCILRADIFHPSPKHSPKIIEFKKLFEEKGICPVTI